VLLLEDLNCINHHSFLNRTKRVRQSARNMKTLYWSNHCYACAPPSELQGVHVDCVASDAIMPPILDLEGSVASLGQRGHGSFPDSGKSFLPCCCQIPTLNKGRSFHKSYFPYGSTGVRRKSPNDSPRKTLTQIDSVGQFLYHTWCLFCLGDMKLLFTNPYSASVSVYTP